MKHQIVMLKSFRYIVLFCLFFAQSAYALDLNGELRRLKDKIAVKNSTTSDARKSDTGMTHGLNNVLDGEIPNSGSDIVAPDKSSPLSNGNGLLFKNLKQNPNLNKTADGYAISGQYRDSSRGAKLRLKKTTQVNFPYKLYLSGGVKGSLPTDSVFTSDRFSRADGIAISGNNFTKSELITKIGWGANVAIGLTLPYGLRGELEYGFATNGYDKVDNERSSFLIEPKSKKVREAELSGKEEKQNKTVFLQTVMTNIVVEQRTELSETVIPYIGIGVGVAHISVGDDPDFAKNQFAIQGMIGLTYRFDNKNALYGGYRIFIIPSISLSDVEVINKINNEKGHADLQYNYVINNLEIGYRLGF